MSPMESFNDMVTQGFPRVSGDEPSLMPKRPTPRPFSPRERG